MKLCPQTNTVKIEIDDHRKFWKFLNMLILNTTLNKQQAKKEITR